MRVAVVGANGLIGRALADALGARGDAVAHPFRGGSGITGARDVRWDPAEGPLPAGALDGVDAVVNLAGVPLPGTAGRTGASGHPREPGPDRPGWWSTPWRRRRSQALVSGSAVGYYGAGEDEVTSPSPPGGDFLGRPRWHGSARRRAHEFGVRVAVIRTGIVLRWRAARCRRSRGRSRCSPVVRSAGGASGCPGSTSTTRSGSSSTPSTTTPSGALNGAAPASCASASSRAPSARCWAGPAAFPPRPWPCAWRWARCPCSLSRASGRSPRDPGVRLRLRPPGARARPAALYGEG